MEYQCKRLSISEVVAQDCYSEENGQICKTQSLEDRLTRNEILGMSNAILFQDLQNPGQQERTFMTVIQLSNRKRIRSLLPTK